MSLFRTLTILAATACIALPLAPSAWAGDTAAGLSPLELVRETVYNEVASNTNTSRHFMFKDHKKTLHLTQTKLLVETRDAMAGMIISQDGHPLNPQQQQQELARLESYINNPDQLSKKRKQEKEDADRTERILKALPNAFLYEADGTARGTATVGREGDELVRLKFHPNPNYNPPTRTEQVLTGMSGYLLIDANEKRMAEIDATLVKEVGFGWGILGHLDRGGHLLVQQADVGEHHWELTHMELALTGKILLFKKLTIRSSDVFSDFRPVPSLSFAQGVELLKKEAHEAQNADRQSLKPGNAVDAEASGETDDSPCCSH